MERRGPVGVLLMLVLGAMVATGCGALKTALGPPLPPPETLGLEARLLPGPPTMGSRTVRLAWTPPRGGVEKVVLEQAESPNGPWVELKVVDAARGFHDESSFFRPNRLYYFRVSVLRGNQESASSLAVALWVPDEPLAATPTPSPTATPTPTPGSA